MIRSIPWFLLFLVCPALSRAAERLELQRGDHICIIGNTLADRMQQQYW